MAPKQIKIDELLLEGDTPENIAEKISILSFEQGLSLLEELVKGVESGGLPLDRSILSYERGTLLLDHLKKKLQGAEEKLRVLQKQ